MTDEYDIYTKLPNGATVTKQFVTASVSSRAMKTGTAFAKSTSTPSKASGHYCVRGCVRTAAFRKSCCRFISVSLNSCITSANAEALLGSLLTLLLT